VENWVNGIIFTPRPFIEDVHVTTSQ